MERPELELPQDDVLEDAKLLVDDEAEEEALSDDLDADFGQDPEHPGDIDVLLQQIQTELEESKQQNLRTLADFQNYRRRVEQEKQALRRYATEDLLTKLIPVLDNFERTVQAAASGATLEGLVEGVTMVDKQFRNILQSAGLTRLESLGKEFDPTFHEALGTDAGTNLPSGTVTAELEPGYALVDKVVRPARVRVAE
jgi:molecular chaperone GrpE